MRVILKWSDETSSVIWRYGSAEVEGNSEADKEASLATLLTASHAEYVNAGKPDIPVIIDAEPRVPWRSVINVMNVCKRSDLEKIEFAAPMPSMPGKS
jgi:biopolymer transport protein ExbD